ncbi:large ribosomal subunit protein eL27-like [Dasypus novemcinctus]|uniref:large ribosomal subunit protein eL27-like n=1 Tax=Dasypus novemcinctus TaxID=9361 RepID=UPI0039C923D6
MGKFMKPRKVVWVLARHYSGGKAIIMKKIDKGTSDFPYSYTLMAGIDCYSHTVTAAMGKKKIIKRTKIKCITTIISCPQGTPWIVPWTKPLSTWLSSETWLLNTQCEAKVNFEDIEGRQKQVVFQRL